MKDFYIKCAEKLQIWFKSDKNVRHFAWRTKYVYSVDNGKQYFVARKCRMWKSLLFFHGSAEFFYIFDIYM